ncbi:MAG: radical SAM protein [Leptospiraceae bacterium]|nr:radical SAM protein [Leptospiraceae bacterium]MCP5500729.1 radical SAM protein [Leptospiraceae bacterium]
MNNQIQFANILFSGKCNLSCKYCIGQLRKNPTSNLTTFPLPGLESFIRECHKLGVREISFSGTNTEPLLYVYLDKLIERLRKEIPSVKLSLHTNGFLILRKKSLVELFDRLSLSFYSFREDTRFLMTGTKKMPDIKTLINKLSIPLKVSILYTKENQFELEEMLDCFLEMGVRRLVLRKVSGFEGPDNPFQNQVPLRYFGNNPVYEFRGMELSWWDFEKSSLSCLNLFADGRLSQEYNLQEVSVLKQIA